MLPRTLEPELMDTPLEALDYDRMDHAAVNTRFVDDVLAAIEAAQPLWWQPTELPLGEWEDTVPWIDVLDLGAGTALIPIELCRRDHRFRVAAVDAAVAMLDLAKLHIEMAGLRERVRPVLADAKGLAPSLDMFAVVMSNSLVHHLPDVAGFLSSVRRAVQPGGLVMVRDLLRPSTLTEVDNLVFTYAAGDNERQRELFRNSLLAAYTVEEFQGALYHAGFDPAGVVPTSDRHWTWTAWV